MILGIDPGPETCGVVLYDGAQTHHAEATIPTAQVLKGLPRLMVAWIPLPRGCTVAVERVQAQGVAGNDVMRTCEVSSRIVQAAVASGYKVRWIYRREVLRALDVSGAGNRDAVVRQRLLEMHPEGKGTKRDPGPLYGVSGHAWQALGVAVAASLEAGEVVS